MNISVIIGWFIYNKIFIIDNYKLESNVIFFIFLVLVEFFII